MQAGATAAAEELVRSCIDSGAFTARRYSWVVRSGDVFLKIPRVGASVASDCRSQAARDVAMREYADLVRLSSACPQVVVPRFLQENLACLGLPYIEGTDLADLLRRTGSAQEADVLVAAAMEILARLHENAAEGAGGMTLVIGGFEARNLRREAASGRLVFFDPHALETGRPEMDVTRFLLSLLMIRWGQDRPAGLWTGFSPEGLLRSYESASGRRLDTGELALGFRRNLAIRAEGARASVRRMAAPKRWVAALYMRYFFRRLARWADSHGF
jgi:hypothetical protein